MHARQGRTTTAARKSEPWGSTPRRPAATAAAACLAALVQALAIPSPALATDAPIQPDAHPQPSPAATLDPTAASQPAPPPITLDPEADAPPLFEPARPAFGSQGSRWAVFGGGIAVDGKNATDLSGFAQVSWFIVDDVELGAELAVWNFDQEGNDATGASVAGLVRWHFVNEGRLSLFVDGGIGLLGATDDVPEGGTDFNFLPRAGVGATWRPWDSDLRLLLGLRWHHISNARSSGAEDNPSRDGAMIYVGLGVPF